MGKSTHQPFVSFLTPKKISICRNIVVGLPLDYRCQITVVGLALSEYRCRITVVGIPMWNTVVGIPLSDYRCRITVVGLPLSDYRCRITVF